MLYRLHAILLALMLACAPALASQNSLFSPTTGTVSGLALTNNFNSAIDSVNTCNSGASAPTNQLSGLASLGNCWWNTSTNALGYNDGSANWPNLGWFDTTNHYWMALTGGGAINNIASSGTTDPCSQKPTTVTVTGTTTITSFGGNCQVGQIKRIIFAAALTLTHNATSLILPNGGNNITTAAGDTADAVYLGSSDWRVTNYTLANGQPLNTSAVAVGSSSLTSSAQGYNAALNLRINASIAGNALTVAIKGTNGSDPSGTNPVLIGFRDATLATGDMIVDSLQSALSFTINSGNTMGASSGGVPFRLWVYALDNAGTVALALINCSNQSSVCTEDSLQNTGAGTTGGSSADVFYSNASALSGKAVRLLGYLEFAAGLTTAGTWNALPTQVQLYGPAVNRPLTNVTLQATPSLPGANGSTTGIMAGFGSACHMTPSYSTRLQVTFQGGTFSNNTNNVANLNFRYGTGTAPAAGAAFTGTSVGSTIQAQNIVTTAQTIPFSLSVVITGLTPGVAYWFDINGSTNGTGNFTYGTGTVGCSGFEL